MGAETVFISYSHDSPEHSARVLTLSDKLRSFGVDAELDQYNVRLRRAGRIGARNGCGLRTRNT